MGAHKGTEWTAYDAETLFEWYPRGGSTAVIAHGVNRSAGAVREHARAMGVRCAQQYHRWTDHEDDLVVRLIEGAAGKLGVTPSTLAARITRIQRDGRLS